MSDIKEGMYVRCLIDEENPFEPRLFALGQVIEIDNEFDQVKVKFHDPERLRQYFSHVPDEKIYEIETVKHCKILIGSKVFFNNEEYKIIEYCSDGDDFFNYYIQTFENNLININLVSEKNLITQFTQDDPDPVYQMKNYEFQNPIWYMNRRVVSKSLHTLKNATYGFEILLGSRVYLLSHQVDTIIRAIKEPKCRFMLADEVGLGKTIEACVIMKGLIDRDPDLKVLLIIPDSLVQQWQNELYYKFWLDIPIWNEKYSGTKKNNNILIFPASKISSQEGEKILSKNWDMCICDETHNFVKNTKKYKSIYSLSKRVKHILLLSATPIQERREEYKELLSLLRPEIYGDMTTKKFNNLLDKQRTIRQSIHWMVRDLDFYYDEDLVDEFEQDLDYISEQIDDHIYNKLLNQLKRTEYQEKINQVKLILSYVSKYYQFEKNIIRHRRIEIDDLLPKRTLEAQTYEPIGGNYNYFEFETYDFLINYLERILDVNYRDKIKSGKYVKTFLSAMFSSPWALNFLLSNRKDYLLNNKIQEFNDDYLEIATFSEEIDVINQLLDFNKKWTQATENELSRINELYQNPELIKGRLAKIVDYLIENTLNNSKFVIFSSWIVTLRKLEIILIDQFGIDSVVSFHKKKTQQELQKAVDKFQNDSNCKFIICDELGGEGRNFQIADAVIHADIPWSPMKLEQRIGRLDRVGRKKDREVKSVVFYSNTPLEKYLFKLWKEGLNIFTQSISGIEIAIEEIYNDILKNLSKNLRYGLESSLMNIKEKTNYIKEMIEEERYYDVAQQLDYRIEKQLLTLIEEFDKDGGEKLFDTMMSWTKLAGFIASTIDKKDKVVIFKPEKVSTASMENALFIPPDMKKTHKHLKSDGEVKGTFSRNVAIKHEDLIFYAPGDPFFDAIVKNAEGCARGRSTAFAKKSSITWQGFIFTWSPEINKEPLLKMDIDINYLYFIQGYLSLDQIITLEPLADKFKNISNEVILKELEVNYEKNDDEFAHLGERKSGKDFLKFKDSNLNWFKNEIQSDRWAKILEDAYNESKKKAYNQVRKMTDLRQAKKDIEKHINGIRASNMYFDSENHPGFDEDFIMDNLYQCLKEPTIRLDSIAFFWLVNKNDL